MALGGLAGIRTDLEGLGWVCNVWDGYRGSGEGEEAWDWCGGCRAGVQLYMAKEMCRGTIKGYVENLR